MVSCRQPNDTTGPTFKFGITVRHPRQRRTIEWTMTAEESQITGIQPDTCSHYMQPTRATHETIVYLHDFPCRTPKNKVHTEISPRLQGRISRMARHRDLAGEYE